MIYYLFIAACILTIITYKKRRDMENRHEKGLLYYFLKNSFEFLAPLTVATFLYIVLLTVISRASDTASLRFLIRLEETLTTIKSYAYFKLSAITVFICFIALYLLSFLRLPLERKEKLYSGFDTYRTWSKRAYIFLVLLCSFTLFGTQVGEPTSDLRVRIKAVREGYADVQREAQEAVSGEVTRQLFEKVKKNLPPAYHQALNLSEELDKKINAIDGSYKKAYGYYAVKVPEAEAIIKAYETRRASGPVTELKVPDGEAVIAESRARGQEAAARAADLDPDRVSYEKVEKAKAAIQRFKQQAGSGVIKLYGSGGGKEITLQAPKVMTYGLKKSLFAEVTKMFPITEPLVDALFDTLDDTVKTKLEKKLDEATKSIIDNPENLQKAVNDEAAKIVNETDVKVSPQTVSKAELARSRLASELKKVGKAEARIDRVVRQAENNKIVGLIAQLRNPQASVRDEAVTTLSRMGDKLTQAHVNELTGIMRRGGQKWSEFLRRESHCSLYEYTSVKYYAASVLGNLKSPYVNTQLASEASSVKSESKSVERVTDPGWI